jgi:hypothetical protein
MKPLKDATATKIAIILLWTAAALNIALGLWIISADFGILGYPVLFVGIVILSLVFPSVYGGRKR